MKNISIIIFLLLNNLIFISNVYSNEQPSIGGNTSSTYSTYIPATDTIIDERNEVLKWNESAPGNEQVQAQTVVETTAPSWWSTGDAMTISAAVLIFGLIVITIMSYFIKNNVDPNSLIKAFGLVLIIISVLFLIVAGYDDTQLAPAYGLLGTIAGYLFGKEFTKDKEN